MPTPPPDDFSSHIHPGIWGVLGAAVLSAGRIGVAWVKGMMPQKEKKGPTLGDVYDTLNLIQNKMATREDVGVLHERLNEHINAHAEGKFK